MNGVSVSIVHRVALCIVLLSLYHDGSAIGDVYMHCSISLEYKSSAVTQ
jgi:hypothetical protein